MSLKRPWFQMYSRDWLDNKELRRCSELARSVLVDLMCLASEGARFGYLEDKVGPLTESYMINRCMVTPARFRKAMQELEQAERIHKTGSLYYVKRMVEDERIRLERAAGGHKGGNPKLKGKDNLTGNHKRPGEVIHPFDTRAGMHSHNESDVGIEKEKSGSGGEDSEPVETISRWVQQYSSAMGAPINPDSASCFRICGKMLRSGKTLDDLEKIFQDLYRNKQKPKGIGWIITVLESRLEGGLHAS